METLVHLTSNHTDLYNIAFLILGVVLGKYKILLIPLRILLDKLNKEQEVANCHGKGTDA